MIAEQYIQEGIRIRKEYIRNLKEILKEEPNIMQKKEKFQKLQNEMESIVHSSSNDIRKTMELNEKLINVEKELTSIQNIIKPYYDKIENLKNDTDRLYLAIKEKYPNITQKEIERDIMSRVEE